jgi:hypothetical protein
VLAVEEHGRELFEAASGWTWKASWPSGDPIRTLLRPSGTRIKNCASCARRLYEVRPAHRRRG